MKSSRELMNELAHRMNYFHEVTQDESIQIKSILLRMFIDLQNLCQKHELRLILGGGTCLGAVRHKGFIPWDDDLDVMMPRNDYNKLISLLQRGELGNQYEFSYPSKAEESVTVFLKIFLKNSEYIEIFNTNNPFPKGFFLDVFPMDAAPKSIIIRTLKGIISDGLEFCTIITRYAKYTSNEFREFMSLDKKTWYRYRVKCILGKIVGIVPRKYWLVWFDKWVQMNRDSQLWTIASGRKYYLGEVLPKEIFIPTVKGTFEGIEVLLPQKYDQYLHNLYGDYMSIPPIEKREKHFIVKMSLQE